MLFLAAATGRLVRGLCAMKGSVIAFAAAAVLGLLSMGGLGALLYYAAVPVLGGLYPAMDQWHGDRVWPMMILSGLGWSPAFLVAGWANRRLILAGTGSKAIRRLVYLFILWLGAVAIWAALLSGAIPVE